MIKHHTSILFRGHIIQLLFGAIQVRLALGEHCKRQRHLLTIRREFVAIHIQHKISKLLRLAAFQRTDLTGAKLRGSDMTGIHLTRAKLDGADLSGSNLAGSDLTRASFRNAILRNARLDAVRVNNADFTGADLRGANLRILEFVNGLSLRNVDARGARFDHAWLARVDISGGDFRGANFTHVSGLTNEQLATACGDATTILPEGLRIPGCNKPD